jgi:hypothetical protein
MVARADTDPRPSGYQPDGQRFLASHRVPSSTAQQRVRAFAVSIRLAPTGRSPTSTYPPSRRTHEQLSRCAPASSPGEAPRDAASCCSAHSARRVTANGVGSRRAIAGHGLHRRGARVTPISAAGPGRCPVARSFSPRTSPHPHEPDRDRREQQRLSTSGFERQHRRHRRKHRATHRHRHHGPRQSLHQHDPRSRYVLAGAACARTALRRRQAPPRS